MRLAFILSLFLSASAAMAEQGAVRFVDAYAHPPIGAGNVGVAYLTIINDSDDDLELVAAQSPLAGRVEIHTHGMEDGVMQMRQLELLELPAKTSVALKPGGLHLMLMQASDTLTADSELPVSLTISGGDAPEAVYDIVMPVKARR